MDPNATPGTAILTIVLRWQDGGRFANSTNREACLAELDAFFTSHTERVADIMTDRSTEQQMALAEAERQLAEARAIIDQMNAGMVATSDTALAERIQADAETPNPLTSE